MLLSELNFARLPPCRFQHTHTHTDTTEVACASEVMHLSVRRLDGVVPQMCHVVRPSAVRPVTHDARLA